MIYIVFISLQIISENSNTASESYTSEEHLSSALLMVTLDHAKNLPVGSRLLVPL